MDTYSKWATAKLYTTKTPITGAELLNDRVLPFFSSQEMGVIRILTDQQEFYQLLNYTNDVDLQIKLADWEAFYNYQRPHASLKGKTPYEILVEKLKSA